MPFPCRPRVESNRIVYAAACIFALPLLAFFLNALCLTESIRRARINARRNRANRHLKIISPRAREARKAASSSEMVDKLKKHETSIETQRCIRSRRESPLTVLTAPYSSSTIARERSLIYARIIGPLARRESSERNDRRAIRASRTSASEVE